MKKLLLLFGIALTASSCAFAETSGDGGTMKISVSDGNDKIVYELNDSEQSRALFGQLPLEVQIEDYGTNEKIFYPKEKLPSRNGLEGSGDSRTLAYFRHGETSFCSTESSMNIPDSLFLETLPAVRKT